MNDFGGPNATVRSCFKQKDGQFLVSLQMSRKAGGGLKALTHDVELAQWADVRVEGDKIVGVRS